MVQGLRAGTPMGSPEKREWNCSHGARRQRRGAQHAAAAPGQLRAA